MQESAAMVHASMQTAELEIAGMDSGLASRGVRSALNCIRGVVQVAPRSNASCVAVTYDANRVSTRQFQAAVSVMGCEVRSMTLSNSPAVPCGDADATGNHAASDETFRTYQE